MRLTPIFDELSEHDHGAAGHGAAAPGAASPDPARPDATGPGAPTRLSVEAVWVLMLAEQEAAALGHPRVDVEHLLLALVRAGSRVGTMLGERGVTLSAGRRAVSSAMPPGGLCGADRRGGWAATVDAVLTAARRRAGRDRRSEASPVDLAAELVRSAAPAALLARLGVRSEELAAALDHPDAVAA